MGARVLIAGGGTGGHATPALAIAETLQRRVDEIEFLFVGTERGVEARVVPRAGFRLELISVISLSRSLNVSLVRFPFVLLKGFLESMRVVRRFRPDVTICTGGYVSGPVGLASAMLGVPLVIHDSNVLPGVTLRLLSRAASLVLLGFEDARRKMGGRDCQIVGNPTRMAKADVDTAEARSTFDLGPDRETLLIIGGSQGARSINLAVEDALPKLLDLGLQVLWQTGPLDFDTMNKAAAPYGDRVKTVSFIDEIPAAYRAATIAVTRAGAMTIAELNLYGVPAILVPLATASENHQELNARTMEREGWARMILQRDIDGQTLSRALQTLVGDPETIKVMAEKSAGRASEDSADAIVDELVDRHLIHNV
jgi:UDP-N-acetylglucosamine--N-acetylmuramyl-(pentapeptide) pyrophosphoryl-undecaprenol N-acetylglucosamine transferase